MRNFVSRVSGIVAASVLACSLPLAAGAQGDDPLSRDAGSLEELLEQVRSIRQSESQLY